MSAPHRFVVTTLILLSLILSGCGEPGSTPTPPPSPTPDWCHEDLGSLVPKGWAPIKYITLDADQCAVFYGLGVKKEKQIAPMDGVVYRRDHGGPPRWVCPYPLQLPGGFYLGEHDVTAEKKNVLSGCEGDEIVVKDTDPEGNVVEASIFAWRDDMKGQWDAPPDPKKMRYELLGWFVSEGGIRVEGDQVIVWDRISRSRSRLAHQRTYQPHVETKTYYQPKNSYTLVEPETELVSLTECPDPDAVCYPEQIVLAFYRDIKDDTALARLMTKEALEKWQSGQLRYGCTVKRDQLDRVLVQDLQITDEGAQSQVKVTAAKCKLKNDTPQKMSAITWVVEKTPDGKWRLKNAK